MKYGVIRGRHRLLAAVHAEIKELRCDVHYKGGRVRLRNIPVTDLVPDPDVQRDFSLNERQLKRMKTGFRPELLGVLDVTPLTGLDRMPTPEKFALKLGMDRDQRRYGSLERYLDELDSGDPDTVKMDHAVRAAGYTVKKLSGQGVPHDGIECAEVIRQLYRRGGEEHVLATLRFNHQFFWDQPMANQNIWLATIGELVWVGFRPLTATNEKRLLALVPAVLIRMARGEVVAYGGGVGERSGFARHIAATIRKKAGLRIPPRTDAPKEDHQETA